MAGVLVLVVARVVASVRLRSRQESSPAVSTGSQESELVDSHLAESTGAPVQAQPRWGTDEVLRRLAAIGSMTLDPRERVRLIQELIRSADLTEPGCGAAFWDFAFSRFTSDTGLMAVLNTLGHVWAIADRSAAWTYLTDPKRTSSDPHNTLNLGQFEALRGLLSEWMRSDVPGALERARSLSPRTHQTELLTSLYPQLLEAWTHVDPLAALDWLLDRSEFAETQPYILGKLFKHLVEVDLTSAVGRFERISPKDQNQWAPVLAAEWANRDPRSAVSWAQARWQQGMGPEALLRGTESWIKTDPVGAAAFIREILPTVTQPAEQLEFAQLWVTAEPSAGLDTLRSLVPTEALEARLKQALPASVPADPLTAANAALKISNPLVRGQTVATVGFQWGARHPEDAMDWAASLPQGGERSMAIREIYRAWTINQFESATTSLNRLEPPLRDQALIGIIHERMNNSASDAASLGLRVTDPQTRAELLDSVFQRWGRSNPADATAWLRKSGLPQALQTQMRARVP